MSETEQVKRGRGCNLIHDSYLYKKDRKCPNGKQYWRCVVAGCTGRVHTAGDGTGIQVKKIHNHIADEGRVKNVTTKKVLCNLAREDKLTPLLTLYQNYTSTQTLQDIEFVLPSYESCRSQMWLARRENVSPLSQEEKRKNRERIASKNNKVEPSNLDFLVDPENDSRVAETATVSSESALTHDDTFLQPFKLRKKNQFKKRCRTAKSQLKKMVAVPNHQHLVMSNLSSLWKNRKLCDAGIGNGTSTVMVHKVVLSAVCPELLSLFSTDISSPKFLLVNFSEEVSKEALNAFAEYMYNGILDVDHAILKQLKIIAKRLDMKEFEQLCDKYLPNDLPQPTDTLTSSPIPTMISSSASAVSASGQSALSLADRAIKVKQEISEIELDQVEKDTATMFGQESNGTLLAPNKSGNDTCIVICPSTETELDNNKESHLNSSSSNQVSTSTTSPSSSATSAAASTSISSVPASSTEFPIPFSQSTGVKSTRLKASPSYETPLVSDLSPVSHIGETVCSQSSAMNEDSSKQLNRQSISTSSTELPSTSTNNAGIYLVGPFTASVDNQGVTRSTNVGAGSPHSQSNAMNEDSSKQLNRQSILTSSIQLPSTRTVESVDQMLDSDS